MTLPSQSRMINPSMSLRWKLVLIGLLTTVVAFLSIPNESALLKKVGLKDVDLGVQRGLDLQGGAYLTFQADLSQTPEGERSRAIDSLIEVIQRRANPSGTSEITVQRQGSDRVIVQLPGVRDVNDAIDRIGRTAELTFLQLPPTTATETQAIPQETGIGGKDVERADVDFDVQSNQPVVTLSLKGEAVRKFGDLTTELNKNGGQLVTLLDNEIIFGPASVSSPITDGKAQLQGNFGTVEEARKVAQQITAGALPVPVSLAEQRSVGPSLGQESISRSLVAGIIGLLTVAVFMVAYYRAAGVLAVGALGIYTLITIALFKLSALTPYTIVMTLAGIAGFILSIGMAVDANILIFERMKEELRQGKSLRNSVEAGFERAWTSIRDSNASTLITCVILYMFGAPLIKGFAVTLGLGVLVSMFTAIVVSRSFLRWLIRRSWAQNPALYGVKAEEAKA